ncbi:hypothetical protein NQZ68_011369 [Dissostichus eleginoides]|nr:hypothetical protein NQZ68_011369 [Dissostichus eleginoides]
MNAIFGHLSTVVSEAFVRFFVELVGHYPLFITGEREDGYSSSSSSSPVPCYFQREGFRKAIPSKTVRRFLEVFMETQMFGWFIQERELHWQALRGLFEVRVQEYLDSIHENEHRRVNRFLKGLGGKAAVRWDRRRLRKMDGCGAVSSCSSAMHASGLNHFPLSDEEPSKHMENRTARQEKAGGRGARQEREPEYILTWLWRP